jgi:hypothetical protein
VRNLQLRLFGGFAQHESLSSICRAKGKLLTQETMTAHACITICTTKDGLMQKDNGAAILMNATPAHSIWRCDHWKQVAKFGYLLQRTDSYSLAHDAMLDLGNLDHSKIKQYRTKSAHAT